jgi:transcription elongation factor GreA
MRSIDHRAAAAVVRVFQSTRFFQLRRASRHWRARLPGLEHNVMQIVSPAEKAALDRKREDLYKMQIDVQERIRKAAALGDLSENAEYHFAKEENRNIQRQLAELEAKLKSVSVVSTDNVPDDVVFLGHTVKLLDTSDDTEQLVRLVGEAAPPEANSDVMPVSVNSPMGDALMKARVGDTVKVKAPRGTMEFKILEIVT